MAFWNKKKAAPSAELPVREPVSDPTTGKPLPPKDTPGFYPGFSTLSQQKYWDAATRDLVLKRVADKTPIRFFTTGEARTLTAVCDRVLPQEDRTPARRIDILPSIDKRLFENRIEGYRYEDMPSDQDAYRLAARAFEKMAQSLYSHAFHELSTIQQETILKQIHDAKPQAAQDLWKQMNIERFWTLLVSDCCSVFYAHPYAWDEIGFGGPAYPRGYMRLEEGGAEPWEVDEKRYQWAAPADTLSDVEEPQGKSKEHPAGQSAGTH